MANLAIISDISEAAVYCGTYAKYNNGDLSGAWLKFSDYSDASEFMAACVELHKDEPDAELMFQDFENFPKKFYGESMSESEIQDIYSFIAAAEQIKDYNDAQWIGLHNQYCVESANPDDQIFDFDGDFFNSYFEGKPEEAARTTHFGRVSWSDEYITFNGYANLESIPAHRISEYIDSEAIIQDIIDNPENYSL